MKKSTSFMLMLLSLMGTVLLASCYTPSKISKEAASFDNSINADGEKLYHIQKINGL